jgi:two-component system, OmpR family, alkaline phosphatase synthesis response regulator PhoP
MWVWVLSDRGGPGHTPMHVRFGPKAPSAIQIRSDASCREPSSAAPEQEPSPTGARPRPLVTVATLGVCYARSSHMSGIVSASILVVDDEPNIVLALEFLLKQAGCRVRTVSNGEAALAAIAQELPDLVLLDVMIPGRDGYAVCQEIRSNPAWRDILIIMLTAKGRDIQREKGLSLGADEYVTKPFSTRELVERVRRMLDRWG